MQADTSIRRAATRPARAYHVVVVTVLIIVGIVAAAGTRPVPTTGQPTPAVSSLAHASVSASGRTEAELIDADVASTPTAVVNGPVVHVCWAGRDGRLWAGAYQVGGAWSTPVRLVGGPLTRAPRAVSSAGGSIALFGAGPTTS